VLLLWMTTLMFISGAVIAWAPSYPVYLLGRVLVGVAIGGFWSMSAATAMRLVPSEQVPRALAIFNGGNALATVIAAPLGSYLGSIVGWRGAFFCLVPVAMLAFAWQWIGLPRMKSDARVGRGGVLRLLSNPSIALGMAAVGVFFMGQFALFTYVRPFLETVTSVSVSTLSMILLVVGVAGFIGTVMIGRLLGTGLYQTLIILPILMAVIAIALITLGKSTVAVTILLGLWGLVATAAPVGWWTWVARSLPQDAEAGGGLMVAAIQLSIAVGSTAGGVLFDMSGFRSTFALSAALLIISAFLAFLASRSKFAAQVHA
jgi:predicted MFS family arabinose efflux permease